jgi:CRP-like cAMP-binding protein
MVAPVWAFVHPATGYTRPATEPVEESVDHSLVSALRAVPSFAKLEDDVLLTIVGDSENVLVRAGTVVIERDSPPDALYVVVDGCMDVLGDEGEEVAELRSGAFFGEFSLLLRRPHSSTVRAREDSELMVVAQEAFDALLERAPLVAAGPRALAAKRLERTGGPP